MGGPIMFCKHCGLRVDEGNRFCRACGQEVAAGAFVAPNEVAPSLGATSNIPAPLAYGGFWVRAAAYLIDGLILGIPFGLIVIVLMFLLGGFSVMRHSNSVDPRAAAALAAPLILSFVFGMIFFVCLQWLYFAGMESSERQATFGKAAMSLRVANAEGRRLSFAHATGRFFAKIVSGMIPLGIGYLMAGFTEKKQALHDIIAGTIVLRNS
jgi:uncharacterized RDD family membrane protein YckC